VKNLIIKGVVVRVTGDGTGLSLNVLARVLEGSWTAGLGITAGLMATLEAAAGTGASLLTGAITPERVPKLHWNTYSITGLHGFYLKITGCLGNKYLKIIYNTG